MRETTKLLLLSAALVVLLAICWPMAGWGSPTPRLLSQHSQPAVKLPAQMVAIVEQANSFMIRNARSCMGIREW